MDSVYSSNSKVISPFGSEYFSLSNFLYTEIEVDSKGIKTFELILSFNFSILVEY